MPRSNRRLVAAGVTALLVGGLAGPTANSAFASVDASSMRAFANCTALTRVYPHGVMKRRYSYAYWSSHGATARPAYRPRVYWANSGLDRDKDGIACER